MDTIKRPVGRPRKHPRTLKGNGLRLAAYKAQTLAKDAAPYTYPIKPPTLAPGVVPADTRAPVMAMDSSAYQFALAGLPGGGFPGFQYLAQLATRAEYRAFASTMSTELTREWIEFTGSDDTADKIKAIEAEFTRLNVRGVIQTAAEHDCYFGRGQIFLDLGPDSRDTPLVLHKNTVPKGSFKRISAVETVWTTPSAYNALDPSAPDFYKPTSWWMLGQQVHASRLMTIITRPLPDILKPAFNFAGMSLSQLAEPYVDNWLRTRQSVADLINNFSITCLATSMEQILQGDDDGADLFKRADLFTAMRSNKGLMLLDKDREEITQTNTPLSGLHELQAQSQEHMCSVSRMPAIVLTGISPSGLNASSDGEIRVFYDWIAAQQTAYWRAPIKTILDLAQISLFGEIDPDIDFNFVPLYQMTPAEEADIRAKDGVTGCAYIAAGVIDPSEERERLAKDPASGYDGLDTSLVIVPPSEPDDIGGAMDAEFEEGKHPRADNGQFGSSGGGSSSPAKVNSVESSKSSEAVKKWGGADLIVDDDGEPLVFVHDSNSEISEISSKGKYGAVFALADRSAGYGKVQNLFVAKGELAKSDDLQNFIDSTDDGGKSIVEKTLGKELSADDAERAAEIAIEQEASDDETDLAIMGAIDLADMYVEMQRLRIALGKASGASVVEMEDENGTSYALLPSENVKNVTTLNEKA